jgi:hypothetical protein
VCGVVWLQPSSFLGPSALSFPQKHPEPFFALAKELYPDQFKVRSFAAEGWGEQAQAGPLQVFHADIIELLSI